jgi:hypothetical protein
MPDDKPTHSQEERFIYCNFFEPEFVKQFIEYVSDCCPTLEVVGAKNSSELMDGFEDPNKPRMLWIGGELDEYDGDFNNTGINQSVGTLVEMSESYINENQIDITTSVIPTERIMERSEKVWAAINRETGAPLPDSQRLVSGYAAANFRIIEIPDNDFNDATMKEYTQRIYLNFIKQNIRDLPNGPDHFATRFLGPAERIIEHYFPSLDNTSQEVVLQLIDIMGKYSPSGIEDHLFDVKKTGSIYTATSKI